MDYYSWSECLRESLLIEALSRGVQCVACGDLVCCVMRASEVGELHECVVRVSCMCCECEWWDE